MKTYIVTFGANAPNSSETKSYETENRSEKAVKDSTPIPYGYYLKSVDIKRPYHITSLPFINTI